MQFQSAGKIDYKWDFNQAIILRKKISQDSGMLLNGVDEMKKDMC